MNYTTCLLATLIVVNGSIFSMENEKTFVPTIFRDEKFISKYGTLQEFDIKDAYKLLETQEKTADEGSQEGMQDALTTIGLLFLRNNDLKSEELLLAKTKKIFDNIKKYYPNQDVAIKTNMCGLFEVLEKSVNAQIHTLSAKELLTLLPNQIKLVRYYIKKNEELMEKKLKNQLYDSMPQLLQGEKVSLDLNLHTPIISSPSTFQYNELLKIRLIQLESTLLAVTLTNKFERDYAINIIKAALNKNK